MISIDYKKNKLLKKFIIDKLTNSEYLNKKHKQYIKTNQFISGLSIINACTILTYPFLNFFVFHNYSFTSYVAPPLIYLDLDTEFAFFNDKIFEKHNSLKIEYKHDDFLQLSKILTEEEMNKFAQEIEESNSLFEWGKYIESVDEKEQITCIAMKQENRNLYHCIVVETRKKLASVSYNKKKNTILKFSSFGI